jgi:hypothetical protein
MTKRQAVAVFLEEWSATGIRNDPTAKRCAWCDFVDSLHRSKQITDRQAFTWSNPFP